MTRQLDDAAYAANGRGPGAFRQTVLRLSAAQKGAAPGAPFYSIYVNRKVGRYVAATAYLAGLKPNGVTAISAALTFTGIGLLATQEPSWLLGSLVWLCLALGYAFDSADGQVARLRGGGSPAGEWLDHVVDSAKISSLHLAVLIMLYRHIPLSDPAWLLVPIGFCIVAAVGFFTMILNDQLKAAHGVETAAQTKAARGRWLRSLFLVPTDYGFLCLVFLLVGSPSLFLGVYTFLFVANAAHLLLASIKWFRDMTRLDRTVAQP